MRLRDHPVAKCIALSEEKVHHDQIRTNQVRLDKTVYSAFDRGAVFISTMPKAGSFASFVNRIGQRTIS